MNTNFQERSQPLKALCFYWICILSGLVSNASSHSLDIVAQLTITCNSVSVNFSDNSVINPISWQWNFPGATPATSSEQSPVGIVYSANGNYPVQLVTCSATGCDTIDYMVAIEIPQTSIVTLGNDTTICSGDSILITATPGFTNYQWFSNGASYPEDSSAFFTPVAANYSVTVLDANGCESSDEIFIQQVAPVANFNYSLTATCDSFAFKTVNLSENATGYRWNFGDGTTSIEEAPTHNYEFTEDLVLSLIAVNGNCSDTAIVNDVLFQVNLFDSIPNVITPNGDGLNDCFQIEGIEVFSECLSINIYDRWGVPVFSTVNQFVCWDGRDQNNIKLIDGVYFYIISVGRYKRKGAIEILR